MGKPEKKGAEQQAGTTKLSLGPLGGVSKAGKAAGAAAGKQQQLNKPPGGANSLAALRATLEQQLRGLNSSLDQGAAKLEKHIINSTAVLEKAAQGHSAQANKAGAWCAAFRVACVVCCVMRGCKQPLHPETSPTPRMLAALLHQSCSSLLQVSVEAAHRTQVLPVACHNTSP